MGFDLGGIEPKSKSGVYFRNNVWYWRPLWNYVCDVCKLSDEQRYDGSFNDGKTIDKQTALQIHETLEIELGNGNTQRYSRKYSKEYNNESYPFSTKNVRNFSKFCKNSGGFSIY